MKRTREEWLAIVRRDYHHLSDHVHQELADHILATHPNHQPVTKSQSELGAAVVELPLPVSAVSDLTMWLRRIFWALLALILATICAPHMHAAEGTSQIDVITFKDNTGALIKSFAAPFTIKCNSNVNCVPTGSTMAINSTASAGSSNFQVNGVATSSQTLLNWQNTTCISVANPSVGNVTFTLSCTTPTNTPAVSHKVLTAYNSATGVLTQGFQSSTDLGDFSTTAPATNGKIPIYDTTAPNAAGGTGAYVPGDPLVQGTKAEGAAIDNPVTVGGKDGSGNNKALVLDASGRPTVNVNGTVPVSIAATVNTQDAADGSTGSAVPSKAGYLAGMGSGSTGGNLTGFAVGDTYKAINISTATTTLLITGVSGRQVRITSLHLIAAGADNVALIEGTGATCGTGTAGMAGGTTAASGYNLSANGGLAFGSGVGTIIQTATAGDSVCAVTSAAVQLSGGAEYAIY